MKTADLPLSNFPHEFAFVIQAPLDASFWVDTNCGANDYASALHEGAQFIQDDSKWMKGKYERKIRIARAKGVKAK